jgi:hypothetical protein
MKNHPFLKGGTHGESCSPSWLDSQTLATLGAAGGQNGATTTGLRADEKAVGALAARSRGLVSTLHNAVFLFETGINVKFDNIHRPLSTANFSATCG